MLFQSVEAHKLLEPAECAFSTDGMGKLILYLSGRKLSNEILHNTILPNPVLGLEAKKPLRCVFSFSGKCIVRLAGYQCIGEVDSLAGLWVPEARKHFTRFLNRMNDLF